MLRRAALAITLLAAPAHAGECKPLADVKIQAAAAGAGAFTPLNQEQIDFARGAYSFAPPPGPYPAGNSALIAMYEDGSSVVVFVKGDLSCGDFSFGAGFTKLLTDLGNGI